MERIDVPGEIMLAVSQPERPTGLRKRLPHHFVRRPAEFSIWPRRATGTRVIEREAEAQVGEVIVTLEGETEHHWQSPHDFQRLYAEVALSARFLNDLSILLNVLYYREQVPFLLGREISEGLIDDTGERPTIKTSVLERLLAGDSLDEIADPRIQVLPQPIRLSFDVLSVSFESPFFSKLKAYLFSPQGVAATTVLASLMTILSGCAELTKKFSHDQKPPVGVTYNIGTINIGSQPAGASQRTVDDYRSDIQSGGVRTIQHFLHELGYPVGPRDGIPGDRTQRAINAFVEDHDGQSSDWRSPEFQHKLAVAIAKHRANR